MPRAIVLFLPVLLLAGAPGLSGQYGRTRRTTAQSNPTAATGAYKLPAATMHGVLHKLSGKEVVLITDGDQPVTLTRTRKTKFLKGGKEIKPSEIALGSIMSVDVALFPDLTPEAVNVTVDSPPVEGATATASKPASSSDGVDEERPASESADPATSQPPANAAATPVAVSPPPAASAQEKPAPTPPKPAAPPATSASSKPPDAMDEERPATESSDPASAKPKSPRK